MEQDPILLLPSFRCGRETPWAGDNLHKHYHKYTLGNNIGESYDFSILKTNETTTADGEKLSDLLARYAISAASLPFQIKWIDAKEALSIHVHTRDVFLFVVRANEHARLISAECDLSACANDEELFKSESCERYFREFPVAADQLIHIPAGTPYSLKAVTCYQLFHPENQTFRLYDWNRTNARGQKRTLQTQEAISLIKAQVPETLPAEGYTLLETESFALHQFTDAMQAPLHFDGSFAVLTCLADSTLQLSNGRMLYLTPGQTLLLPQSCDLNTLSSKHCLLTVSKV